jgi:phosphomannomutase
MDYIKIYTDFLKKFINSKKKLTVVFDFSNGMAGIIGPKVFNRNKSIKAFYLNEKPNSDFPAHGPNPIAPGALDQLSAEVTSHKADLGIAFDADGDRAVFMDEKGRVLPAHVSTMFLFNELKPPFVVDELIYNSIEHIEHEPEFKAHPSRIGSFFVKQKMQEIGANFAAEYSGHYYFKDFFNADSGLFAAIVFMNALSKSKESLSNFYDTLPKHVIAAENLEIDGESWIEIEEEIINLFLKSGALIEQREGITLDFGTKWLNIRKSNTEPLIRLVSGSGNEEESSALIEQAKAFIKNKVTLSHHLLNSH